MDGHPWAIAYLHLPIAACDYKLDKIQSNFVKIKQEAQGYNTTSTSGKLEVVQNTLKIMWWFLQENFDDFHGKILTIFLWKVDYVLQKNLMIFGRKFNAFYECDDFCRKIWQILKKNFTIFAGKFDDFCKKIWQLFKENPGFFK